MEDGCKTNLLKKQVIKILKKAISEYKGELGPGFWCISLEDGALYLEYKVKYDWLYRKEILEILQAEAPWEKWGGHEIISTINGKCSCIATIENCGEYYASRKKILFGGNIIKKVA